MTVESPDIRRLTSSGVASPSTAPSAVPRPSSRRVTRIVLPVLVILGVLGVGGYAAWVTLSPVPEVWVMPVVSRPVLRVAGADGTPGTAQGTSAQPGEEVAVAPAWVEPDPYAITVAAFAKGVVLEVLALEGQKIQAGDVVVRLDPTDAKLAVRRAEAERDAARAEEVWAAGAVKSAEARERELDDEIARAGTATEASAGTTTADRASLERSRRLARDESQQARAFLEKVKAQTRARDIMVEQAALELARHDVRSPVAGIVADRLVEPGMHVGMGMGMQMAAGGGEESGGMKGMKHGLDDGGGGGSDMSGSVLRLFDPAKLQARAEVTAPDSVRIAVGMEAQMTSDAAPNIAFRGVVSRIVPAVDVKKNTVDVKVSIENSEGLLRPGMQMRVKFLAAADKEMDEPDAPPTPTPTAATTPPETTAGSASGAARLMVPTRGLRDLSGNKGTLLVVVSEKSDKAARVEARDVTLVGEPELGYVEVKGPVTLGERVVARTPSALKAGDKVRVAGELKSTLN